MTPASIEPSPNRPAGGRPQPARSARSHLLLFAGALLLPILLFAGMLAWFYVDSERERAEERARLSARELAVAVDRELAAPLLMLQALATSPLLQAGDLQGFYALAREISQALSVNIVLRSPGRGQQVLNTAIPWGAPLHTSNPDILAFEQEALRNKQPVVSNAVLGPLREHWVVVVMVPVMRKDEVAYFLSVGIPAEQIRDVLEGVRLNTGWVSIVVDRKGTVIARSVDHDKFVGQTVPMAWNPHEQAPQGLWTGRNLEGEEVLSAYVRSPLTQWMTAVSVPVAVLDAPLRKALTSLAGIGVLLLVMAAALAYGTGSRLARSIESLKEAGAAVARGEEATVVSTPVQEVNQVGRTLAKAANQALRREAHLKSILATIPSAMVIIDSRGIIQSFSATAEEMFGYAAQEVLGRNVGLLMPEPDRSAHDGYIDKYLSTGAAEIGGKGSLVTGLRKDGSTFPVELHVGEAQTMGEKIFTGFLRDQTETQRIEQELRQTQKMEAIGQLTGGVAHDFNNLLTVIKGNVEMLEAKLPGEEYRGLLADVQSATDLAAELTASLLAFGRRMPLDPQLLDVGRLVSGAGELLRRTLGENILIRTIVESSCRALVDPAQLQNAILNLGINARDAMPNGGRLTIAVAETSLDQGIAGIPSEVPAGRYVLVSVTDTGTGMTPEVRERAFEPFFTTKPAGAGSGLGLSMVYGFVKQSGGHIALHSEIGYGTAIRIYLPCAAETGKNVQDEAPAPSPLPLSKGETVLLVEDDPRVRRVTASRLKSLGYEVLEAGSGPEALPILALNPDIDLLFTDMVMPGGMSGAQLAAQAHRQRPELRVLFTSGYAEPDIVRQADAESRNWIRKPYRTAELAEKLRSILDPAGEERPDGEPEAP